VSGTFTMPPQASANVGNPPVGYYRFFVGDGSDNTAGAYYKKDSTGTVTALVPASYTDEQAQDAIGALLADSNNIDVTYNDAGNVETIVWRNPWMGLVTGASKTYAATDIGGFYTRSNAGAAMTDTLPALTVADNGYSVGITNLDTAASITFSTASPQQAATFSSTGIATYVLRRQRQPDQVTRCRARGRGLRRVHRHHRSPAVQPHPQPGDRRHRAGHHRPEELRHRPADDEQHVRHPG
jgi:hypothetical protein